MASSASKQPPPIGFVKFAPEYQLELVQMWRESFAVGVGVDEPHTVQEQIDYLNSVIVPNNSVRVAFSGSSLVGFIAASMESIEQLYVRVGWHRRGVGTELLNWAKSQSNGSLELYTFERNLGAQAFYERAGFQVVARGFEPTWQLNDLKYRWSTRPRANAV